MKNRSGIDLMLGFLIGVGLGASAHPGSGVMAVYSLLAFALMVGFLWYELRALRTKDRNQRAIESWRESLDEMMMGLNKAWRGAIRSSYRSPSYEIPRYHTLTGEAATDDIKDRALHLFKEETGGDDKMWEAQPEFAREGWYRSIEEQDKEAVEGAEEFEQETREMKSDDPVNKGAELP